MPEADRDVITARRWLAALVAATAVLALCSNGAYHDDDLKHYLFARWVRYDSTYLAHVWGRPGFTLLYVLPAQINWTACRLLSVALSAVTAWATYRCARRLDIKPAAWVIPLLYAQPLFLHLSFTTLTETPAAMYLALATWALLAGRARTSAAVFSLTLLTRHEAIVLLPIWAWAVWRERGFSRSVMVAWLLLFWAPFAHNIATRLAFGFWPADIFAAPGGATHYGRGTPFTYLLRYVVVAGPVIATLSVAGARTLWTDARARPLVMGTVLFVAAQTMLYMKQAYATGGYARFLVPLSPWIALAALAAVQSLRKGEGRAAWIAVAAGMFACVELEQAINPIEAIAPYWFLFRTAGIVLLGAIGSQLIRPLQHFGLALTIVAVVGPLVGRAGRPHRLRPRERDIAEAMQTLCKQGMSNRPLCSANDWPYFFADAWYPARHPPVHEQVAAAAPGSIFVWEARYAPSPDANIQLTSIKADTRWKEILASGENPGGEPFVRVFERQRAGAGAGGFVPVTSTTRPAQ